MTTQWQGNYVVVEHVNVLKLVWLNKHFCRGPAYFQPLHILHRVSYEASCPDFNDKVLIERLVYSFFSYEGSMRGLLVWLLWENGCFFPSGEWHKTAGKALAFKLHPASSCFDIDRHVEKEGEKILTFLGVTRIRWCFWVGSKLECEAGLQLPPGVVAEVIQCPTSLCDHSTCGVSNFPCETLQWGLLLV